jgi:hypothetical protein
MKKDGFLAGEIELGHTPSDQLFSANSFSDSLAPRIVLRLAGHLARDKEYDQRTDDR